MLEQRFNHLKGGAAALPDPSFNVGILNLPTDSFALNEEPMTQLRIGASQIFPRGNTRELAQEKFALAANEQPFKREERRLMLARTATILWLEAFQAHAKAKLIAEATPLFDKLGNILMQSNAL